MLLRLATQVTQASGTDASGIQTHKWYGRSANFTIRFGNATAAPVNTICTKGSHRRYSAAASPAAILGGSGGAGVPGGEPIGRPTGRNVPTDPCITSPMTTP